MDATTTVTIISTIIGVAVTILTMFILMIKFVKEPLEKRMDRLDSKIDIVKNDLQAQINKVETKIDIVKNDLQAQINKVDQKVDDLYQMLLAHFMKLDNHSSKSQNE